MNCFYHTEEPAVGACVNCGVGLCKECVTNAAYTKDNQPICLNCSKKIAEQELSETRSKKKWALFMAIFSGIFIILGIIIYFGADDAVTAWIVSGVAGIPAAYKRVRRTKEEKMMDDIEDRYKSDVSDLLFGWIIRLVVSIALILLFAPICALYSCISSIIRFAKSNKNIATADQHLQAINFMLYGPAEESANSENPTEQNA